MRVSGDFFSSDCSGSLSLVPSCGETEGRFETLQTLGDGRGLREHWFHFDNLCSFVCSEVFAIKLFQDSPDIFQNFFEEVSGLRGKVESYATFFGGGTWRFAVVSWDRLN